MWDYLSRVDWSRLTHAYGWARDAPLILRNMIAPDQAKRAEGWDAFWSAINHQGDFYDSTVAAIPFLIDAAARPGTPGRAQILDYFRSRWLEAPEYGGDPLVTEPPGGTDIPIPMLTDEERAAALSWAIRESVDQDSEEEFDIESYRRMDLCAWQVGRAIQAGRPTFERLLDDPDPEVAAAAATVLLLWPDTRALAKQALIRTVAAEANPVAQAQRILEFGLYASAADRGTLAEWITPDRPGPVRAAAALVFAWVVSPAPLPEPAAAALRTTAAPGSDAFASLPWAGVYHRGPWILPANAAELAVWLAESETRELRWRAVQGLAQGRETSKHLSAAQVVPVLLRRLSDDYNRIRQAAALALSQRGEAVLDAEPNAVPVLIRALEAHRSPAWGDPALRLDSDASTCGHVARLLAVIWHRLTSLQRQAALAVLDRAARRYAGRSDECVRFGYTAVEAFQFLKNQRAALARPQEWSLTELLAAFAFPDQEDAYLSAPACDRLLAEAYARTPEQVLASAMAAVRMPNDRTTAIGAAKWLMTLGPAAGPALEALDAMADGPLDDHARDQARAASTAIREALLITRDGAPEPAQAEASARQQIMRLLHAAQAEQSRDNRDVLVAELIGLIKHPDAYVRAGAADGLAILTLGPSEIAAATPVLQRMLEDEAFAEVGIAGAFECGGRLFHWRQERRSPRASAIRALFAIGWMPAGDYMLKAMLAEAAFAKVTCGAAAEPQHFTIAQWRMASEAAGGLAIAEPLIRATRQQCRHEFWQGNSRFNVCEAELAEVIRILSGRLLP